MGKINYKDWSKEKLIARINKIEKRKKYGLVWDLERDPEEVVESCKENLPILIQDKSKSLDSDDNEPNHIIIEGDNFDSLSILSYTHKKSIDLIYIDPPYNTGAEDWKYNNRFIHEDDQYKHSRWLSMMRNRLLVAKKVLKKDGSLICAIDENEQARLGLLLEDLFPAHETHLITIVHNTRGKQGKNFSYTNEFAYFVIPKNKKTINDRKKDESELTWGGLRNWGGESDRDTAKNCFYPIIFNAPTDDQTILTADDIIGFGDVCEDSFHPNDANIFKENGVVEIYPIDTNGNEKKWTYARQSIEEIKDHLRAVKVKGVWKVEKQNPYETYRTVWPRNDVIISSVDDNKDLNLEIRDAVRKLGKSNKYDASVFGSQIVNKMVPGCDFDFPKSIHTVYDCINSIVGNKKDAVILDYFAGSGTTGHATLMLNKKDGGKRQFILCTNNENNIAVDTTLPRMKAAIIGTKNSNRIITDWYNLEDPLPGNLKYFTTSFTPALNTDGNNYKLANHCIDMISLRENTYKLDYDDEDIKIFKNNSTVTVVLLDETKINELKSLISDCTLPINIYIFSLSDDSFQDEFEDIMQHKTIRLFPVPSGIRKAYKNAWKPVFQ